MQLVGLTIAVVPENLDVVEHLLDDLFVDALQFSLDLVAIVLRILGVQVVDPLGLVLDPGLDVVQLGVGHLGLLVDLLGQPLELLQPGDLVVNHLITLLVEHHQLVPRLVDRVRMKVAVELLAGIAELAFEVAESMRDALLLVQPRRHVLDSEPLGVLRQPLHFDERVGEVPVLHDDDLFLDPLME